jgi:hypothetical protein
MTLATRRPQTAARVRVSFRIRSTRRTGSGTRTVLEMRATEADRIPRDQDLWFSSVMGTHIYDVTSTRRLISSSPNFDIKGLKGQPDARYDGVVLR